MADINDWNVAAASNNGAAPNGFAEGMLAGSVNNSAREVMAVLARHHKDNNGSLALGGTSTALTVTLNQSSIAAWYDGLTFAARITTTCGATPTINPTGSAALGAKSLYWAGSGTQLAADDLIATAVARFMYEATSDKVYVFAAPPIVAASSETVAGKVELATQAEVNTGTDTARAITPAGLTGWTPAVGTVTAVAADLVLLADASASNVLKKALISDIVTLAAPKVAIYQNQQNSGTAGPTFTAGSFATFPLTTEVTDPDAIGSLASNQITLGAGTYLVRASGNGGREAGVGISRLRLFNATDTSVIVQGVNGYNGNINTTAPTPTVEGYFTLAGEKAIELQIEVAATTTTGASALSSGEVEVYATVIVMKLA